MPLIVLVVIVVVVLAWLVSAYNGLIGLKNQVANAWKQIDVQLKRRHDLIPNLVNTVKGAMQFERDTLDAVVTARNKAIAVQSNAGPAGPGVAATAAAESQLTAPLGGVRGRRGIPRPKATGNVAQLQEELTTTTNKIAFARRALQRHGHHLQHEPAPVPDDARRGHRGSLARRAVGITHAGERDNVAVDLSMAPRSAAPPSSVFGHATGHAAGPKLRPVVRRPRAATARGTLPMDDSPNLFAQQPPTAAARAGWSPPSSSSSPGSASVPTSSSTG